MGPMEAHEHITQCRAYEMYERRQALPAAFRTLGPTTGADGQHRVKGKGPRLFFNHGLIELCQYTDYKAGGPTLRSFSTQRLLNLLQMQSVAKAPEFCHCVRTTTYHSLPITTLGASST